MYADYTFYLNDYRGQAVREDFDRLAVPASAHINHITFGRALNAKGADLEAVKLAMCAVVDELYKQEHGGVIASESNDGISRSYVTGAVAKSPSQRIYSAAAVYLSDTNLLFVGV